MLFALLLRTFKVKKNFLTVIYSQKISIMCTRWDKSRSYGYTLCYYTNFTFLLAKMFQNFGQLHTVANSIVPQLP